ncbi:DUF4135 domain-containing protein [Micromonospora gifhornensis]|uniref:DUF4135 domain-containing protein n=1 Tax=Micromonospora gifhornensis TaxID=84594 RepID=UPI003D742766
MTTTSASLGLGAMSAPDTLLGLGGADERLLNVIALAAPFDEREAGVYFAPVRTGGRRKLAERSQRWLRSAVADDDVSLRALLLHRQQTNRDLGAGLVDVVVRDPGKLPDWAYALVDFLLAQPPTAAQDPAAELVGGVFVSFQRAAIRLTGLRQNNLRGVALTPEAADDVTGQLVQRLIKVCHAALGFELQIADGAATPVNWYGRAGIDVSRLGWLGRLESLPGLAYLIGVTCLNYKRAVGEIFDRLHQDLPMLRRELWAWADPGALASYSGDSGDLHDSGRTVSLLSFAGGQRVVYKPKDLSSVAGFMDVLTFLNTHGLPLDLTTRRVLLREGYGWEEYVVARPCVSGEDPARFYRRLGMLTRLAQLLECRDLWADNLIAIGERPMFIDLENVLQGRMRKPVLLGPRAEALWHEIEESVAKTAVVSYPRIGVPGRRAHDIGCCAPMQEQLAVDSDGFPDGWEPPPYRPMVDGRYVDPAAHADDVLTGYREMDACLVANARALAAERGPLHLLSQARVRYIWRSTWDYLTMLQVASGPLALTDGVAREIVLARLFRGAREVLHTDPRRTDSLEMIEREIEALRRLDIPLFQSEPMTSTVRTPEGSRVENHFSGTAWQRLRDRLDELVERAECGAPMPEEALAACLDFASGGRPIWAPPPGDADGRRDPALLGISVYHPKAFRAEVDHSQLLAGACAAADDIIAAAVPVGDGQHGWVGAVHYPAFGLDQLEPLHGDLLTGTAGIAVFLAELYQTTGKPTYWAFAQDALAATTEFTTVAGQASLYRRMAGGRQPVGGFVGIGATIYALARCGQVIGDPQLLAQAQNLVPTARDLLAAGTSVADPVTGRAGLLLALLKLTEAQPCTTADELAASLYEQLLAELPGGVPAPYPAGVALLDALPSGAPGVAMALARYAERNGRSIDDEQLAPAVGSTSGALLAATVAAAALGRARPAQAQTPTPAGSPSSVDLLDRIELGLAAWRGDGDEQQHTAAHAAARTLLSRRASQGRWFPDRRRADRTQLSAVDGLAAAGLACLALAEEDVTSLRTMS